MDIAWTATIVLGLLGAGIVVVHLITAVGVVLTAVKDRALRRGLADGAGETETTEATETEATETGAEAERSREGPKVSVVIPAKNEQYALPRLLASLEEQDTDDFEIVLVNDRSTDATARIMKDFAARHGDRVRVVTVIAAPEGMNPKQNALDHGAAAARGEIMLLTDSDCVVPREWVRLTARYFDLDELGVIFGPVYPDDLRTWLSQYQSFDHVFRYFYTAGSAGIGNPTGGFGNNLAIRREALDAVGGFGGLRHSVTEDAELICEVRDTGRWLIRSHLLRRATVHPEPQRSVAALLKQGVRWNTGALFAPDPATRASFSTVMLFLFVSVITAPLAVIFPPVLLLAMGSFVSMTLMGVMAGAFARRPLVYWWLLVPNVVVSMVFYSFVTLLTLLRMKISWKGSSVRRR
ncbi:MAG: glycosyltransferase [Spirochaetaceae bacterium]